MIFGVPQIIHANTATASKNSTANWTMLVFVQAKNNLSPFAHKNFSDMATIGSNKNLNILVEWHQPEHQGVWRYKIEKGKMVLDVCLPIETDGNSTKDLVDSMEWAVSKYPAEKYSLVLWNHGIGILDPLWGKQRTWAKSGNFPMDIDFLSQSEKIDLTTLHRPSFFDVKTTSSEDGILSEQDLDTVFSQSFVQTLEEESNKFYRGILFNEHSRTYMDNQSLSNALYEIKNRLLNGKKIDLLGMDACLMAMVEVGYLAKECADYFVSSQEVELAHGWNYLAFLGSLAQGPTTSAQAASNIVDAYDSYYKNKIQFYTQSAVNLAHMDSIKQNIDTIVGQIKTSRTQHRDLVTTAIKKARSECLQFSAANYIDLHSFYYELHKQLENKTLATSPSVKNLRKSLMDGMKLIDSSVIANVTGKTHTRARGLSIYYPRTGGIDGSYGRTDFAKNCSWASFIKEALLY